MARHTSSPHARRAARSAPKPPKPRAARFRFAHARLFIALGLVLGILAVYGQALRFELVYYDTERYIVNNPHVSAGLSLDGLHWAMTSIWGGYWMPLTWLSHMLDCQLYGLRPWGHILSNLALHIVNTLLLFYLLRQMTGSLWRGALVAALFAFHPQRVESVVWVAERKDVLSAFFFLLSLLAYSHYARGRFSPLRYGLVLLAVALGLMAKPSVVTLPCLMLLLDFWPLRRWPKTNAECEMRNAESPNEDFGLKDQPVAPGSARPASLGILILEKVPLFLLAGFTAAYAYRAQAVQDVVLGIPLAQRVANVPLHYAAYLGKTFWPFSLSVFYPLPKAFPPLGQVAAATALLAALSVGALWNWRRRPYLTVGWFWFVGLLVPMIGLIQVYMASIADRYTYLAQIGLWIVLAWGAADLAERFAVRRSTLAWGAGALLLLMLIRTANQVTNWRDDRALWTHAALVTPVNDTSYTVIDRACVIIGAQLKARGDLATAADYYRQAVQINPKQPDYRLGLARTLAGLGQNGEALAEFEAALKLRPAADAKVHHEMGTLLISLNRLDEAIERFSEAHRLDPRYVVALSDLGNAYAMKGNRTRAIQAYQQALALDPQNFMAHFNLGLFALQQRDLDAARRHLERAAELEPRDPDVPYQLAKVWTAKGAPDRASDYYRRALDLAQAAGNAELARKIAEEWRPRR